MLLWALIAVVSAVGNAGVPMGCFFLTVSLMTGIGAPVEVMGLILPIYTMIDMIETAENVWSDSCVCAMTERTSLGNWNRPVNPGLSAASSRPASCFSCANQRA